MRKRVISTLLCMLMIAGVITAAMPSASAAIDWNCNYVYISYYGQVVDSITFNGVTVQSLYAPRNQVSNYDSDTTLCCAAFVKRFYENVFGVGVYNLFDGATPCISYGGGSFSETSSPVVGDIARGPNHWAIVKAVSGNTITLIEQNAWSSDYTKAAVGRRIIEPESTYTYFHYSGNTSSSAWYDSLSPVNLGDVFYGVILNTACWKPIGCSDSNNVELQTETGVDSQQWRFERQSDNSYKIMSSKNGQCLDLYNFITDNLNNIGLCGDNGTNAQRWYIYQKDNGYVFASKCSRNSVMDLCFNNTSDGTNIQIYQYNGSTAQIFSIYKEYDVQIFAPSLSAPIINDTEVTFNWSGVYGESGYKLNIQKKVDAGEEAYSDTINTPANITTAKTELSPGKYEAYVETYNYFEKRTSAVVSFTVSQHFSGDANCDGKVNLLDGVLAQKVSLQIAELSEQGIANADMNGDGKITILDAILIQKKALSL